jgi:hypothetical protein
MGRTSLRIVGWLNDPLSRLEALAGVRDDLQELCRRTILEARQTDPPTPWQDIADALGQSKQATWERYRDLC